MEARFRQVLRTEVALLHGKSMVALYRQFLDRGYDPAQATVAARSTANLARLHQPAVTLATPYQLLRIALRGRGYEADLVDLEGRVAVVDEIHAYDPDTLGMIAGLLRFLEAEWQVPVLTVSASLPSWVRSFLPGGGQTITADPALYRAFGRHRLQWLEGSMDERLEEIVGRVRSGERVLVSVNQVSRAQQLGRILHSLLPAEQVLVLHSRYTAEDRQEREITLQMRLREGGEGLLVVATQVIEVSLDLDFDTLFSEPAPIEARIQRFGRVNRRRRLSVADVHVVSEGSGDRVYDPHLVVRTGGTIC